MSDKEDAAYAEWAKDFRATKLATEEQRAAFDAISGSEGGRELYRGYVREADYYRRLNEHGEAKKKYEAERAEYEAEKAKMLNWWKDTEPAVRNLTESEKKKTEKLAQYQTYLATLGIEDLNLEKAAASGDKRKMAELEAIEQRLNAAEQSRVLMDQALPKLLGDYGRVLVRATKEGYEVDPSAVIEYAIKNNTDTVRAFEALTADERGKRAEAALAKKLEDAKAEGAREAMAKASTPSRVGFPKPANDALSRLFTPQKGADGKPVAPVGGTERRQAGIEAIRAIANEAGDAS